MAFIVMFVSRPENKRSFYLLNWTQFLGALNDNVFKLLIAFLLIHILGSRAAPTILSITGAVFVIPFLLFSNASGVLADRFSKRNIIVAAKLAEFLIMLLSLAAIYFQSIFFCYFFIFWMATQSAVFGPSKYGIIPELVDPSLISKANGLINSFTYLAIILGTFLAPFITNITHKQFIKAFLLCIVISFLGFLISLGIQKTPPKDSKKKINPFFFYEIYKTLALAAKRPHLFWSVLGSSFFLFLGGFTQLNLIPFALQSLHLSEIEGGYLFLPLAIGIAIGSLIAGKLSKETIEMSLSCIAGFFLSVFFILLWLFSPFLLATIVFLFFLGIAGGIFIIPFDSFIQFRSPQAKMGQIIAASNFLSFLGVLLAAMLLYLFSEVFLLSASTGFLLFGIVTFIYSFLITGRLSELFFPFLSKRILCKWISVHFSSVPSESSVFLLPTHKGGWLPTLALFSLYPRLRIYRIGAKRYSFPFFNGSFTNFFLLPTLPSEKILKLVHQNISSGPLLLWLHKEQDLSSLQHFFPDLYTIQRKTFLRETSIERLIYRQKYYVITFQPSSCSKKT
ncbi:MAG: MFS transporter [Parachlamydiales bacterium]|nr:MFS transporter [Parachlamydiales bacterium]